LYPPARVRVHSRLPVLRRACHPRRLRAASRAPVNLSQRAVVAIGRSILVIAWHPLSDPSARSHDLGLGYYATRIGPERRKRNHIRQLEALGCTVTLQPAA
jgi:hypothetical protein